MLRQADIKGVFHARRERGIDISDDLVLNLQLFAYSFRLIPLL